MSAGKIQTTVGNVSGSKRPLEIPWAPKRKGRPQIQLAPSETETDPKLIKAIARAQAWLNQLAGDQHSSIEKLAAAASYSPKVIRQGPRLAFFAPEIAAAALVGETPTKLKQIPKLLPLSWREQRQLID